MIAEKEILERIATAIDELDMDGLAMVHNQLTRYDTVTGAIIEPNEGWHLVPVEGAH